MRTNSHWLEESPMSVSVDFYRELAYSHACEGGKQGAHIAKLIHTNNMRGICEFEVDYTEPGLTAHQVVSIRQALAFFTKIESLEIGVDKEEVAFRKFLEAEELCRQSNDIFKLARCGGFHFSPRVNGVLYSARRKIARVLGDVPQLGELTLRFGPGATRATKRKDASIRRKVSERLQCSEELIGEVPYLLQELPHLVDIHSTEERVVLGHRDFEEGSLSMDGELELEELALRETERRTRERLIIEEWDRVPVEIIPAKLSFVPKNAKTYRSICTEPGLNAMLQLGYGDFMARRLAAFGIDIRDQSVNQRRAEEGSRTGALATLDLSSASDTVSRECVFELLPLDWACALNRARSGTVLYPDGREVRVEKFSSMGNGFTFPLETLIFWGLAASCCHRDSDATVYGDDIVIPTDRYDLLVEVLTAVGFKVNAEKSYHTGPFRESCGKDYFSGTNVRPYYPKRGISGQSLFVLHNFYWRRGDTARASKVESVIHPDLRIYGPDGYGDGHLLSDSHPRTRKPKHDRWGWSGYFFDTYVTRTFKDSRPLNRGEYVIPLYSIYRRSAGADLVSSDVAFMEHHWGVEPGKWGAIAPLPLPEVEGAKAISLPGVAGYKKITVYTLGG